VRVLIDSSAWIEFLNGKPPVAAPHGNPSRTADAVSRLLGSDEDLCTCGLIVTEVLQGLRRASGIAAVIGLFQDLTFLEPAGIATYLRAAEVYRQLRQRGVTVRSTIDCLIATLAEEHGCAILARDRDLELILGSGLLRTAALRSPPRQ
jgi:predicted nucleic acid-binding protein